MIHKFHNTSLFDKRIFSFPENISWYFASKYDIAVMNTKPYFNRKVDILLLKISVMLCEYLSQIVRQVISINEIIAVLQFTYLRILRPATHLININGSVIYGYSR